MSGTIGCMPISMESEKRVLTLDDFLAMEALERSYYDPAYIAPAAEAYAWYRAYPASTVARFSEGGALLGFINLFPVQKAVFDALMNGTFNDSTLTVDDIAPAENASFLFLSCIAVAPEARGRGLSEELLLEAVAQYRLSKNALLVTDNVTEAGARFSERIGLRFIKTSDHNSRIYAGEWENVCK